MANWHKTNDREEAYRAMINMWLKADPVNVIVCKAIIEQNKQRKKEAHNSFGGARYSPKDLRVGLSLPPGLYYALLKLERFHGREFMKDKKDLWWFAKKFPQFTVAERI